MNSGSGAPVIYAVVLAAGAARRFGGGKLLQRIGGETLVARAALRAREACGERSVLVAGCRAGEIVAAARGHCAITLENPDYARGLGSSIALAARHLASEADALLLLLADQPGITACHLARILTAWSGSDSEIVATAYETGCGPPVLMPSATFEDLAQLDGDQGARALFGDARFKLRQVAVGSDGYDVDTPADLKRARRRLAAPESR